MVLREFSKKCGKRTTQAQKATPCIRQNDKKNGVVVTAVAGVRVQAGWKKQNFSPSCRSREVDSLSCFPGGTFFFSTAHTPTPKKIIIMSYYAEDNVKVCLPQVGLRRATGMYRVVSCALNFGCTAVLLPVPLKNITAVTTRCKCLGHNCLRSVYCSNGRSAKQHCYFPQVCPCSIARSGARSLPAITRVVW